MSVESAPLSTTRTHLLANIVKTSTFHAEEKITRKGREVAIITLLVAGGD